MPETEKYQFCRTKVKNRGRPPVAFLDELIAWGRNAPDDIFAPNSRYDIYSSIKPVLGPWRDEKHRRAALLEVLRVLGGFESSWRWDAGIDVTNPTSNTPCTEEAGIFQCSGNSMRSGRIMEPPPKPSLREVFEQYGGAGEGDHACNQFRKLTKDNHAFAFEYCARLLRITTKHHGPVKREEIHAWLSVDAMNEIEGML
jgi:hypothetical protein